MHHYSEGSNIIYKNTMILRIYNGYEEERASILRNTNKPYYANAWEARNIYK